MNAGDTLSLTIDKPAAGGRMIARVGGQGSMVVLVSGAIPGERVKAVVERTGKGVAYATVTEIEQRSADRRDTVVDSLCGGCLYVHIAYPRQLALKSLVIADAFARIGRIAWPSPVEVAGSPETGYRMRARVHVRDGVVGFFREGTHQVCAARQTGQLRVDTLDTLDRLAATLRSSGAVSVREIEVAENGDASDRVVSFDTAEPLARDTFAALAATTGLTGAVSPSETQGSPYVRDTVTVAGAAPIVLRRHVHAFFQGNRYLLDALVSHVVEQIDAASDVVDLYAGVGLFSVAAAAARDARVTAVEGDRVAAADLLVNAGVADGRVSALHQSVEQFALDASSRRMKSPAVIVVDPPRTGLSREALDGVTALRPARVVYVSCDIATLARDARRLVEGGYSVQRIDAFDLFPNTPHVETVVVFGRA